MRTLTWTSPLRPLVGVIVLSSVAACSALTSFDGLTGGAVSSAATPEGGAATDAPTNGTNDAGGGYVPPSGGQNGGSDSGGATTDASTNDAGTGGSTPDAGSSHLDSGGGAGLDAGTDAPAEAAAPSSYCASLSSAPIFCDDFDEGALGTPWDQVSGAHGAVSLDSAFSVSAPNAMLVSVNSGASNVDVAAYKSFPSKQGVVGVYTMDFDVRVETVDTSSSSDGVLAALQFWNGSAYWDLQVEVVYASGALNAYLTEDSASVNVAHIASQNIPMKTWSHVTLAVAVPSTAGSGTQATLSLNGAAIATATVKVTTNNPIPEILLGVTYATPSSGGWTVRYDNVTLN